MLLRLRVLFGVLAVSLAFIVGAAATAGATTPNTALVYGDSLTFESRYAIASEIALHPGWSVATHAFPGTAPCDWIPWLATDLAAYQPSIFAIETAGNHARPCMVDAFGAPLVPGSAEYYAKISTDLSIIFQTVTATGARVVFIKAPPMLDPEWNIRINKISSNTVKLAKTMSAVSVSSKPRTAVSTLGKFAAYKPCLTNETATMGCANGEIAIRTLTGIQTGIHFCPIGLSSPYPYACDVYSSGEYRFGKAIAQVLVKPPAPFVA